MLLKNLHHDPPLLLFLLLHFVPTAKTLQTVAHRESFCISHRCMDSRLSWLWVRCFHLSFVRLLFEECRGQVGCAQREDRKKRQGREHFVHVVHEEAQGRALS